MRERLETNLFARSSPPLREKVLAAAAKVGVPALRASAPAVGLA